MGRKTTISFEDIMMSELVKLEDRYSSIIKENKISEKVVSEDIVAYMSSMAIKDTAALEQELTQTYDGLDKDILRDVYTAILEAYIQGYRIGKHMKIKNIKN